MSDVPDQDPRSVAGGRFLVDVTKKLPDAGGGIAAFAATGRRLDAAPMMALRVRRDAPARARALQSLASGIDGLLTPIAHGIGPPIDGQSAWYVICQAPSGPPLSSGLRPWPEASLIELVLRPIAQMLEQLQVRGMTHRGIRPNNVFHGQPNRPVTLGAAWAAPPAMHQPAVYETPYSALCHPAGRGDGRIADDVYALGVLLVTLALGRDPMAGLDDKTILYRKLELGDFPAIMSGERLTPLLTDLVRGMLAEDPEHRPTPALLRDPASARGRRVAARPAPRAPRPFKIGETAVWNNRTLAMAMALDPSEAVTAIQGGTAMYWLRRGLGDATLAVKLEELVRQHALDVSTDKETSAAMLVMRAVMDADVLMPLCWRGLMIFPEGLGPALAVALESEPETRRNLHEIVNLEVQGIWAGMRDERTPAGPQRLEARQRRAVMQIRGPAGGLPRLAYTLNPLIPCASALLGDHWIANIGDLAVALDAVAAASRDADLFEPQILAFIGARSERSLDQEVQGFSSDGDGTVRPLAALRLLSELQQRYHSAPMKGLTAWIALRVQPLVERWQNRQRRAAVDEQLKALAALGFLRPILTLLRDQTGQAADTEGLRVARAELEHMDAQLRGIAEGDGGRAAFAARLGQEIAAGIGLAVIALTLFLAAIG
jgi:hypothetical protein